MKYINKLSFFLLLWLPVQFAFANNMELTVPFVQTISDDTFLMVNYAIPNNMSAVYCELSNIDTRKQDHMSLRKFTDRDNNTYQLSSNLMDTLILASRGFFPYTTKDNVVIVANQGQFELYIRPDRGILGGISPLDIKCDFRNYSIQ
jgi:hypothetical protein